MSSEPLSESKPLQLEAKHETALGGELVAALQTLAQNQDQIENQITQQALSLSDLADFSPCLGGLTQAS